MNPPTITAAALSDPHYSTTVYAELWGLSTDTVARWFQDEPGVLKCSKDAGNGRRKRVELRIPVSVAERVYRERTK